MSIIIFVECDISSVVNGESHIIPSPSDSINRIKLTMPCTLFYAFYETVISVWLGRNLRLKEILYEGDVPSDFDSNWFDYRFVDGTFIFDKCIPHHAKFLKEGKDDIYKAIENYKKQLKILARRGLPLTLIDYLKIVGCKTLIDKPNLTIPETSILESIAKSKNLTVSQLEQETNSMIDYINFYSLNLILDKHPL